MSREYTVLHKRELIEAHGGECINCGEKLFVEWHHIVPLSEGGQDKIENIVPLCHKCHMAVHFNRYKQSSGKYAGNTGRPLKELTKEEYALIRGYVNGKYSLGVLAEKMGYKGVSSLHTKSIQNAIKDLKHEKLMKDLKQHSTQELQLLLDCLTILKGEADEPSGTQTSGA